MKVSEIFVSIQGEGRYMGQICIFLRLHGCNLFCSTCDTKYARDSENYKLYTVQELKDILENIRIKRVVVTGGEPLLQKGEVLQLVKECRYKRFLLETNGTVLDSEVLKRFHLITVSPKRNYPKLDELFTFWSPHKKVDFKFVVGESEWCWTFEEIPVIVERYDIKPYRVWLMPEATTSTQLSELAPKVWDFCVSNNYNYSDRLQIRVGRR